MYLTLGFQAQGFLISIGTGFLLGAFYDIFRIYRTAVNPDRRTTFFQDLFYMFCAAFVTFLLALGVNYGEVRFYILAGELMGWCLYFLTIGFITIQVFTFISRILNRILFQPIKKILHKFNLWIGKHIGILCKNVKKGFQTAKKRLKQHRQIVYNQSNRRQKNTRRKSNRRKIPKSSRTGRTKGRCSHEGN